MLSGDQEEAALESQEMNAGNQFSHSLQVSLLHVSQLA